MKAKLILAMITALALGAAQAKLPPPTEEQQAKAAAAKAKAALAAQQDAEQLAKAQDRVVQRYLSEQKARGGKAVPTKK
ncbi:MAG TPA: hypothetical protein VMV91_16600 [Rhodocyclaceae bacterium]|nr:hypothetical protein [Rhodocyclaceae bacterium]